MIEKEKEILKRKIANKEENNIISLRNVNIEEPNSNSSTIASQNDKNQYNDLKKMKEFIESKYKKFYENFELTNFISAGGTGKVFEGYLKRAKKKQNLAFKFKISDQKKLEKDSQEISIHKKCHHNNITEIYAFIKMDDYSNFCVLELGKHGDLENFQKKLLKRKVLSETMICYFAKQILEALQYIHRCKIIHMDIKEGNILVDSNLNVKLTDFSVSCSYSAFHPEDLVKFPYVGTSKYMSPEIIGRTHMKIKEGCKIDIYSLGVTLYDLAFGCYPFNLDEVERKDYDNILKKVKEEKLEFPKDRKVSNLFKDFLKGLLEIDYTKRFSIQKALNHPWVKGADIIFDEKEQSFCYENFLINLITDNIPKFNDYLKENQLKYNLNLNPDSNV